MKKEAYLIFSFENFLEAVNFKESILKDQIVYLLFYVTKISQLRKDMAPEIISDRLNDQIRILNERYHKGEAYSNLKLTTPDSVKEILSNSPECFQKTPHIDEATDRNGTLQPFVLAKEKEDELNKRFNYYWKEKIQKQKKIEKSYYQVLIILFLIIGLSIMIFQVNNSNKLGISWQDYQKKAEWEQMDNYQKSIYLLYYITKVIEFKDDMTPSVLSDRLVSLRCKYTPPDSIKEFLHNSDLVIKSYMNKEEAFKISSKGEKVISEKVGIVSPYKYEGGVDLIWIWKNRPDIFWTLIITFFSVFIVSIKFAYNLGKRTNLVIETVKD